MRGACASHAQHWQRQNILRSTGYPNGRTHAHTHTEYAAQYYEVGVAVGVTGAGRKDGRTQAAQRVRPRPPEGVVVHVVVGAAVLVVRKTRRVVEEVADDNPVGVGQGCTENKREWTGEGMGGGPEGEVAHSTYAAATRRTPALAPGHTAPPCARCCRR